MPVNPYITFPVWQQAVTHSFTFVHKEAGLGKSLGRYEPSGCSSLPRHGRLTPLPFVLKPL